ncbi:MAG: flagellar basal-body MS-ring/collar protein FliF [Paracoccus sp. (in: a-proteobacteria)]|uniref:flagellar basal-body MS-ring/collar protein FliF n=1 Tax=Paracoccus sp. TaxID=267 RepID=UPI0026E07B26|nr:flagellar basal-body MS-ring/collar protein FliF [Paracoccus sp. (in: a-proteobacteria)]MDO5621667.1 flagellar basal-body MS-ring/collar protein FliF [Paracoccus sp. (in: a-proteobacteria)]
MQKLQDYWRERNQQQKLILISAFAATFLGILALTALANRTEYALLYSGLESKQAGEIVSAVERAGVPYQVRGDSIYVESASRDRLRLELAGQNLPSQSGAGYELLDGISGFGTTSQMFDAAYWRAKEGELARTILALPNVKTARVHLAASNSRGFRRNTPSTASVTIQTNGRPVTSEQAKALKHMISSAAPGMLPDSVTVIDADNGVVSPSNETDGTSRAQELKSNVERLLESHVGPGNAIVEVNLDVITESELIREHRYDPDSRALVSQEIEETSDQSSMANSGPVTAASNLPEGTNTQGADNSSASNANRQRSNFEVSQLTREISRQPGATRRLSVAVLVNGTVTDGQITPRPEAELTVMRELVASTVGFDEERGDQITVKSLPFADLSGSGTLAKPSGLISSLDLNTLAKIALVGIFTLLIGLLLMRSVAKARGGDMQPAVLDQSTPPAPAIDSEQMDIFTPGDAPDMPMMAMAADDFGIGVTDPDDPVARMKQLMSERREESLKLLASWLGDKETAK